MPLGKHHDTVAGDAGQAQSFPCMSIWRRSSSQCTPQLQLIQPPGSMAGTIWVPTWMSHFSTAPPTSEGLMRALRGTSSPSADIMPLMSPLGRN